MIIGWCRECGHDRAADQDFCCACGSESKPFIVPEHERERGELELPFGLTVDGLDTIEGRRLFFSEQGQAALQDAYRVLFTESEVAQH